jgi:hypothetical protein
MSTTDGAVAALVRVGGIGCELSSEIRAAIVFSQKKCLISTCRTTSKLVCLSIRRGSVRTLHFSDFSSCKLITVLGDSHLAMRKRRMVVMVVEVKIVLYDCGGV